MEQIKVKNFLILKDINLNIGRVNIIIGTQASGKSLLAKLLYFFKKIINDSLIISIKNLETQNELIKRIRNLFEEYFPKYTWKTSSFEIIYIKNKIEIKIYKSKTQREIKVDLSEFINKTFRESKNRIKKFTENDLFITALDSKYIFNNEFSKYSESEPIFIPANRSFFTILQKNIFSFLSKDIKIDPFIKEFGAKYETIKQMYHLPATNNNKYLESKMRNIVENIIKGEYKYINNQDWIKSKESLINLANASSGQQEALPMLMILSSLPLYHKSIKNIYFVEEPEAHLFPTSQKHIIDLLALIYNNQQNIFITTHSPYILVALNNLLLSYDIKKQKNEDEIKNIIDKDLCINFDDIKAYTIKDGKLKNIKENKERLIGINIIDSVSDDLNNTFDKLLSLQE